MNFSHAFANDPRPIGVFDSGVGGLTVLKSLMMAMPGERFVYLGDTARVPYGTKSAETVRAYSLGLADILMAHDVKMIVIACNTASVHAAEAIAAAVPVPVISMIEPAAKAAYAATKNKSILVMGTQSTIRAESYPLALKAMNPDLTVLSAATQVLVALAEEGWIDGPVTRSAVERYIAPFFERDDAPDTIILGCTHFPLMKDAITEVAGKDVTLIDCGTAATEYITTRFKVRMEPKVHDLRFLVTDSVERFASVAERFLGMPMEVMWIDHIDLAALLTTEIKKAS